MVRFQLSALKFCQKEKGLLIHAYVIMPSHIHLIVQTANTNGLSPIIQSFKSYTANQILKYIKNKTNVESRRAWLLNQFAFNARKNKTHSRHQVWQRNSHPIILYSPYVIRQKWLYIHNNPVAAKIVDKASNYLYSSASNYTCGNGLFEIDMLDGIWNDVGYVCR